MAPRLTEARLFEELLDRYGLAVAEAFLEAVRDLRTAADLQRLIIAIQAGNMEAAIAALHLDAAAYGQLIEAIRSAYVTSGASAVSYLPRLRDAAGTVAVVRFDIRNPRAEAWLTAHSSGLVTNILADQRDAIRQRLTAGMVAGANPKTTALDIVGRLNRATGQREGGVIGLTSQQEQFVRNARAELASGDPADLKAYLTRSLRDKRFDKTVEKAIASGEPIPAELTAKALRQYESRLLKLRGDIIGRTESLTALNAARHEAFLQAVDRGAVSESDVRKVWKSAGDMRVRHTHQVLNGDAVGLRERFKSPSGAQLMFPGDPSAPASEIIGCRCIATYRIERTNR